MLIIAITTNLRGEDTEVDAKVKAYEKVSGISGNLNSVGSDTLNNLMTYWAEAFQKEYPNVKVQTKGEGSATAARSDRRHRATGTDVAGNDRHRTGGL